MAKTKLIQTNFTGGELSPLMLGRVDTVKHQNGAEKLRNMLVRQQGGAWMRGGTIFAGPVKDQTKFTRLYEFEYSSDQNYIIEFGHLYVRIWYNGGFVETAPASGIPLEVVTPYTEAQLKDLTFTQSADVLYVFHGSYMTKKLQRFGANSWLLTDCNFQDGPYLKQTQVATVRVSDYSSTAKATSNLPVFSVLTTSFSITAVNLVAGHYEFTTNANHGWATGQVINLTGVTYTLLFSQIVSIAGRYTITVTAVNKFWIPSGSWNSIGTPPITSWGLGGSLAQADQPNPFFEYREENNWMLAKVLTITDSTHADCTIFSNIKITSRAATLSFAPEPSGVGRLTSSVPGTFTYDDIGKYIRSSAGNWHLIGSFVSDVQVWVTPAYGMITYDKDTTFVEITSKLIQGTVTSNGTSFTTTDLGRLIRLNYGNKRPWGKIVTFVSANVVRVQFYAEVPLDPQDVTRLYDQGVTDLWLFGAWSDTTGYPKCGVFHEQRLWAGGTAREPLNIWGSQTNDYENMAPTEYDSAVLDTNALNYTLVADKANPILWMESSSTLLVGTLGSEWKIKSAGSQGQPITPANINAKPEGSNGTKPQCKPVKLGTGVLFLQKAGNKVLDMLYDFNQDSEVAKNLCIVSEHILREGGGAVRFAFQREPNNVLWALLADGTLATLTYERDQQVAAWAKQTIAGPGAFVESIAVTGSNVGKDDVLHMVVRRTINGATKRYIEILSPDYFATSDVDLQNFYLVDCGLTYSGAPVTSVSGLDHLEGETVAVVGDGLYRGTAVVNAGAIAVIPGGAASKIHVGYSYQAYIKTLRQDGGSRDGATPQGKTARIAKTAVRVFASRDFKYGVTLPKLDTWKVTDGNGIPTAKLKTGDAAVNVPMGYSMDTSFYIVQDKPEPLVVLAIMPDTEVTA